MIELPPLRPFPLDMNCGYLAKASGIPCTRKALEHGRCKMHYLMEQRDKLETLQIELRQRKDAAIISLDKAFPLPTSTPSVEQIHELALAIDEVRRADERMHVQYLIWKKIR